MIGEQRKKLHKDYFLRPELVTLLPLCRNPIMAEYSSLFTLSATEALEYQSKMREAEALKRKAYIDENMPKWMALVRGELYRSFDPTTQYARASPTFYQFGGFTTNEQFHQKEATLLVDAINASTATTGCKASVGGASQIILEWTAKDTK